MIKKLLKLFVYTIAVVIIAPVMSFFSDSDSDSGVKNSSPKLSSDLDTKIAHADIVSGDGDGGDDDCDEGDEGDDC